jgi:hypothetical protein
VPGIEKRTQHIVAAEIEAVRFVDQEHSAAAPVERMINRRRGRVVSATSFGNQQLDQGQRNSLSATAHRAEQCKPRRNSKTIEHPTMQNPQRNGHALLGCGAYMLLDQRQDQAEQAGYVVLSRSCRRRHGASPGSTGAASIVDASIVDVGRKDSRQIVPRQTVLGQQLVDLGARDLSVFAGRAYLGVQLPDSPEDFGRQGRVRRARIDLVV